MISEFGDWAFHIRIEDWDWGSELGLEIWIVYFLQFSFYFLLFSYFAFYCLSFLHFTFCFLLLLLLFAFYFLLFTFYFLYFVLYTFYFSLLFAELQLTTFVRTNAVCMHFSNSPFCIFYWKRHFCYALMTLHYRIKIFNLCYSWQPFYVPFEIHTTLLKNWN